jgi:hypothetical protein
MFAPASERLGTKNRFGNFQVIRQQRSSNFERFGHRDALQS